MYSNVNYHYNEKQVTDYLDTTTRQRGNTRSFLFLDEISSIKRWEKGIMKLWDQGRLKNCTIIVTGSHSIDLTKSDEKLPGRRGETSDKYDKIMLPMKFSEYIRILDKDLSKIIDKDFTGISRVEIFQKLFDLEIDPRLDKLTSYSSELDRYLTDYLLTGGIPKVIDDYLKNGHVSEQRLYLHYHHLSIQ